MTLPRKPAVRPCSGGFDALWHSAVPNKMPEKRYACRGCKSCVRCWKNRLRHANPIAQRFAKAHPETIVAEESTTEKAERPEEQPERPEERPETGLFLWDTASDTVEAFQFTVPHDVAVQLRLTRLDGEDMRTLRRVLKRGVATWATVSPWSLSDGQRLLLTAPSLAELRAEHARQTI